MGRSLNVGLTRRLCIIVIRLLHAVIVPQRWFDLLHQMFRPVSSDLTEGVVQPPDPVVWILDPDGNPYEAVGDTRLPAVLPEHVGVGRDRARGEDRFRGAQVLAQRPRPCDGVHELEGIPPDVEPEHAAVEPVPVLPVGPGPSGGGTPAPGYAARRTSGCPSGKVAMFMAEADCRRTRSPMVFAVWRTRKAVTGARMLPCLFRTSSMRS